MTHSDLALAGIACAAVPGMQPVSVQEWRRPEATDPAPAQRALIEDATGRRWVVIVPRTVAGAAELERNDALTRQLGKHLPFKVPVATGFAGVGPAGRAAVFPYVEGSAINFHRIPAGPGLSSAIGRALAAVHNMPSDFFDEFGVPTFDAESHRQRRLADLDRAAETGLVPGELLSRWELAFDTASLWRFAVTPVHGSLNGWSFLVAFSDDEAATARVVALTSWEQACVSDPADDFAMLVKQATPAAVDSVLESYTLARANRPDRNLLIRARLASEMSMLRGLAAAVSADDQDLVDARVDELRKLSRLTSADDPLVPDAAPVLPTPATAEVAQTDDQAEGSDGAHALRSVPPFPPATPTVPSALHRARIESTMRRTVSWTPRPITQPTPLNPQATQSARMGSALRPTTPKLTMTATMSLSMSMSMSMSMRATYPRISTPTTWTGRSRSIATSRTPIQM
ncbi:phosphotransferase [Ornithinimicrobium sp. INDO-MA30-4]|uniref:phosphotransferase n=1 Tax=Ornithinimicrobium sp. INDO-MA30-4 TaxID=2908651 RepID=UPI001F2C34FD|nr:phosphotransferase [Ornithinimicrobium sp. INDO-MA30-4]UJH71535.1 phosphotransferase [Ornithinimicrobium sp. INDO-MA30-4]